MNTCKGFSISHSNTTVTVTKSAVSREDFADEVNAAHLILSHFHQSSPGSTWGCDGIGFEIQAQQGIVRVHKSGVGPRKFKNALASL